MSYLPLDGVRVIEICNVAAGPYCGMLLADMGADVVKIENPHGGDTLRSWPPLGSDGFSENFASLNRNKRSITLNLKEADDRDRALELIADADILIENNRPGVMKRLGLDYDSVHRINKRLVYCSISAFGQDGPRANEGGFDLTIQAMAGVMSITGHPGQPPVKCGVAVADFASGIYAAFAASCALRKAVQTGRGTHIDVPMMGTTLAFAALQTSEYFGTGLNPQPLGSAHPRNAPYQAFRCRDGYFALAAGNNSLWERVCDMVGRPEWVHDERFTSTLLRAKHQQVLCQMLEEIFHEHGKDHWLEQLRLRGVPCAPINGYEEALSDEQVLHMNWVQPMTLPGGRTTKTFASPLRFDGEGLPIRFGPPALGEHNDHVLQERPEANHVD